MTDLSDIRREYDKGHLRRSELPEQPMTLFTRWLEDAKDYHLTDPTAMSVSTVDEKGRPYQRIVLLKQFDEESMVFFTNLESRKAKHIENNNNVSLLFPWHSLERQVHVTGQAQQLSTGEVLKYFTSRPKDSQIAAWVSEQSSPISTRQLLMTKFHEMKEKFKQGEVPLPKFWGGYRVSLDSIEFWQGGEARLHDRFLYEKQASKSWKIERLSP